MATLATCRTLTGEVADEWLRGLCRPERVVRRSGFEKQLLSEPAIRL